MNEPLARELRPAVEAIDFITNVMEENDEDSTIEDEWKYIALIIGRVLRDFGRIIRVSPAKWSIVARTHQTSNS